MKTLFLLPVLFVSLSVAAQTHVPANGKLSIPPENTPNQTSNVNQPMSATHAPATVTMPPSQLIAVNDCVQEKATGPVMTVQSITGSSCVYTWLDEHNANKKQEFNMKTLRKVDCR